MPTDAESPGSPAGGLKKKLLFVIPSLAGGGAERTLVHILNHLDKGDFDVNVMLFEDDMTYETEIHFPVRWVKLGKESKWDVFKLVLRLRAEIGRVRPDTVIASLYYANILTIVATFGSRTRPRTVLCEHSDPRRYPRLYRLLIRLVYRRAHAVVSVSGKIGSILSERFGVDPERITVIHNPVPVDVIAVDSRQPAPHPFLSDDRPGPVIAGMGRLIRVKRFDRLLEAFADLHRDRPESRLIILGDGPLKGRLSEFARELRLEDVVCFAGFQSNPYPWIAKADLFVLSSDVEGFPMAILEAMAAGTCVVSTDTPSGPGECIEDGVNGRLVAPDSNALAKAMSELAADEDFRKRLSEAALRTVRQYHVDAVVPHYCHVFRNDRTSRRDDPPAGKL